MENLVLSVSEFLALTNQTLEYAYPSVEIEGEVSGFKVNQGKYVFFDLKDDESTVGCFMMVFQLRTPIEDGMRVVIKAAPKITKRGKFSLTVMQVRPVGEGSLRKSFELLQAKLAQEGLFNPERKRSLPPYPRRIAVISSTQAAGYADFMKIANERWGGVEFLVAHVQVQGDVAADQIIRALGYFNQLEMLPEIIVLIRGGGSADDLAAFNDEPLVRAIASSRAPVVTGIGHETDRSLADLAADLAASTPSNAAQLILQDRRETARDIRQSLRHIVSRTESAIAASERLTRSLVEGCLDQLEQRLVSVERQVTAQRDLLRALDPRLVLRRGYALVRGQLASGAVIEIETATKLVSAEVKHVEGK